MTKMYRPLHVGELIDLLGTMPPRTPLADISTDMGSYRGYYEHVYIEPAPGYVTYSDELRTALEQKLGTTMRGYKGGSYEFRNECYVFLAQSGLLGPALCGFEDGEPVTMIIPEGL